MCRRLARRARRDRQGVDEARRFGGGARTTPSHSAASSALTWAKASSGRRAASSQPHHTSRRARPLRLRKRYATTASCAAAASSAAVAAAGGGARLRPCRCRRDCPTALAPPAGATATRRHAAAEPPAPALPPLLSRSTARSMARVPSAHAPGASGLSGTCHALKSRPMTRSSARWKGTSGGWAAASNGYMVVPFHTKTSGRPGRWWKAVCMASSWQTCVVVRLSPCRHCCGCVALHRSGWSHRPATSAHSPRYNMPGRRSPTADHHRRLCGSSAEDSFGAGCSMTYNGCSVAVMYSMGLECE